MENEKFQAVRIDNFLYFSFIKSSHILSLWLKGDCNLVNDVLVNWYSIKQLKFMT